MNKKKCVSTSDDFLFCQNVIVSEVLCNISTSSIMLCQYIKRYSRTLDISNTSKKFVFSQKELMISLALIGQNGNAGCVLFHIFFSYFFYKQLL